MSPPPDDQPASPLRPCFSPGSLLELTRARTAGALASGALQPIRTRSEVLVEDSRRWLVRVVDSLARKDYLRRALSGEDRSPREPGNPFLPYDEELYVADINASHLALLNKFNVIEHHLLLVTRRFADQEEVLNINDFLALQRCMREYDCLAFYNGGEAAGASQRHKHLQLVPWPPSADSWPLVPAVAQGDQGLVGELPELPWVHGVVSLAGWLETSAEPQRSPEGAQRAYRDYRRLMAHIGVAPEEQTPPTRQRRPYNLLVTADRMWAVARSQEFFQGLSINALGFAGALLVRTGDQLEQVRKLGPLKLLRAVAVPR